MNKIYLLAAAILFSISSFAQVSDLSPLSPGRKCATAEVEERFRREHPNAESTSQFESWLKQKILEEKAAGPLNRITPTVVIPVVFHIIHNAEAVGTGRNVSQNAIRQQILQLNKDYANLSNSQYGVSEDMGIVFALAQNDPTGVPLAEPGIDRIDRNAKGWTAPPYTVGYASASNYLTTTLKPGSIWDPERYLNVWITQYESGILGIATFPASSTLAGLNNSETNTTAGVAVDYTTIGSVFSPAGNCAAAYGKGKTLTHELGHFFGLRHIWGDAACGTDYCDDTPVHYTSNSGEPVHPKPNSCGTADEMFENYMDYSDDIIANTFTINQGDRMEAVFANSPRRANLATSNAGVVYVTASNQVQFADCDGAMTVSETSTMTTCPKYKDISVMLNIEDKATAASTLTINAGGTAVSGVDYQLLTPVLSFASGDNYKPVVIRILDNGISTGNRTIVLSYSISGSGVTAASQGQSLTITIADDDLPANVDNVSPTTTLFSEDFNSGSGGAIPAGWVKGSFTAGSNIWTTNAVAGAATGFGSDGRMLHITNTTSSETATTAYTVTSLSNPVALTKAINSTGFRNIKLEFDYACNGQRSGTTNVDYGQLRYSTTAQTSGLFVITDAAGNPVQFQGVTAKTHVVVSLPAAVANVANFWIGFEWVNNASAGAQPPFIVDNIVITGENTGVETAAGQAISQNQLSGQTVQYVSASNKIIADVTNPDQNVGCITATVISAGTGTPALLTTGGSFVRSDKVIQISPAAANATATYNVTLYYTAAELAALGTPSSLKLLKVKDGVALNSTLSGANTVIYTPVVNDLTATKGYASFSTPVTGGFSQFFLASSATVLPVSLIDFNAKAGNKVINLIWNTSSELNNRGFGIERSTDGITYDRIGWVDGNNTTSTASSYSYADSRVQAGIVYYYRLVQTNTDGRETLSDVRKASLAGAAVMIALSPNPAKDLVKISVAGGAGPGIIRLLNEQGRVLRTEKVNFTSAPYTFSLKAIASGVYFVQVQLSNALSTEKLIVE